MLCNEWGWCFIHLTPVMHYDLWVMNLFILPCWQPSSVSKSTQFWCLSSQPQGLLKWQCTCLAVTRTLAFGYPLPTRNRHALWVHIATCCAIENGSLTMWPTPELSSDHTLSEGTEDCIRNFHHPSLHTKLKFTSDMCEPPW